jgi:DNA-binding CsgD family transcriptional regulator
MTQRGNSPGDDSLAEAYPKKIPDHELEGAPGSLATSAPAVLFLIIAVTMAIDVVTDSKEGTDIGHLLFEASSFVLALAGFGLMWRLLRATLRKARDLQVALDGTRADLVHWRAEAQELLLGLGEAIDRQFERWGLSPAEGEVALLLLKGLSLKEVAETRTTSERTVRQQALAVYRKAGLAGRAELAAFFLEDLLLPRRAGAVASEAQTG